jgi:glucose/arabinose dehydrogenase
MVMSRKSIRNLLYIILILILAALAGALYDMAKSKDAGTNATTTGALIDLENNETSTDIIIEEVVNGLEVPWSIVWTSPMRMLVAERPGRLRVVDEGVLRPESLISFEVTNEGEAGLMGVALDPEYESNKYIYVCYAFTRDSDMYGRVVRIIDRGTSAGVDRTVIDNIPSAEFHAGCRVAFGPDGKLYITTGDASERNLAQNLDSLAGKILRLNKDGTIPQDNPFADSPIWSYGHRNPQGISWHPITGEMYETEHGPSGFDGPGGGDEVNRIVKGGNYGWPLVSHEQTREGIKSPLLLFTPAVAPASAVFYSGEKIPAFKNNFFFGALVGEGLYRVIFDESDPDKILFFGKLPEIDYGRIRAVAEGPDGYLYFSTSNRDGRGRTSAGDDRIFRILPN